MPKSAKYLLIGSTEAYSGKSATVLGLAQQLQARGLDIAYGKPLGTSTHGLVSRTLNAGTLEDAIQDTLEVDEDVQFIGKTLKLPTNRLKPTALFLDERTIQARIRDQDAIDYRQVVMQSLQPDGSDLVLLEGAANLEEGTLFGLSLAQLAEMTDAPVLLVARFHSLLIIGALISAQQRLGDRLLGVVINDVPEDRLAEVRDLVQPYLERHSIPILGILPRSALLRSVSVNELAQLLQAEVLCRRDRLDLRVESLKIGAMNVNSALKYFRKGRNMAVVTGGDRTDIQLAALETSTQCLILTGQVPPMPTILGRAEDLEIPILSVDLDTLTTVEIIDRAFGQVRVNEPVKVDCMRQLMEAHFNLKRLLTDLGVEPAAVK